MGRPVTLLKFPSCHWDVLSAKETGGTAVGSHKMFFIVIHDRKVRASTFNFLASCLTRLEILFRFFHVYLQKNKITLMKVCFHVYSQALNSLIEILKKGQDIGLFRLTVSNSRLYSIQFMENK